MKFVLLLLVFIIVAILFFRMLKRNEETLTGNKKNTRPDKTETQKENEDDHQLIEIDDFLTQYIKGESIPEEWLIDLQLKRMGGEEFAFLPQSVIEQIKQNYAAYSVRITEENIKKEREYIHTDTSAYGKDWKDTLEDFLHNVNREYPARIAFDQLINHYHQHEEFEKERKIIQKAIQVLGKPFPHLVAVYQKMLEKTDAERKNPTPLH